MAAGSSASAPRIRSMLYVPGDDDRKLAKVDSSPADAVVLDLEDSVAPERRAVARDKVRAFLDARPRASRSLQLWVRINALDDAALVDLAAVVGGDPDGIVLPKVDGPDDVTRLEHCLDALEVREGLEGGSIVICAVATETPDAVLRLPEYASARFTRLAALNWGAEDLSAAVGAATNVDEHGRWTLTYRWARSAVLLAAKAAGVQALDTVHVDFRDLDGLAAATRESALEGFTGRVAIHPDQVEPINRVFTPSAEDIALAESIVAAFEQASGPTGTIGIDGVMYDIPHLKRARRLLASLG
ncbi:CoA ester lyase [Cnuibacter physcomitrellae]|uniref:HpcH/HpaI aldolase/citrate lyase family protein n=1 Tax=Cnuibacter physcomitrellae TaxID=1619308 RepID=UPI00217585B2|nr:CoA ester lyase [Cnuibacter physcomitrellae]MCS5498246.1 CoA ester lyase [Cnuibacter physcomitrellae]